MEKKEVPPSEVSLKYMAWNVKEISENIKKMAQLLELYFGLKDKDPKEPTLF